VALWPPQLVKVRAGKRGSGWAVGRSGVLTALHVVRPYLANPYQLETNASGVRCLAVTGGPAGEDVFECAVVWQDEAADLALLQIAEGRRDAWWARLIDEAPTVLAAPGTDPVRDVSAIGFPDATLAAGANRPDPDQPTGTLLPSSGVPGRIGFDVSTSTPEDHPLWQGLSGAAVREAVSGRLFAIVAQALPDRAARRLYASPLPNPDMDPGWAAALAQVGAAPVLEDRHAPEARRFLTCYDPAGRPWRVRRVPQLGDFGVRRARDDLAPSDQPYFPFAGRPEADSVEAALNAALAGVDAPRFVLLVGESAAASLGWPQRLSRGCQLSPSIASSGPRPPNALLTFPRCSGGAGCCCGSTICTATSRPTSTRSKRVCCSRTRNWSSSRPCCANRCAHSPNPT
jgi:hypothetical protein